MKQTIRVIANKSTVALYILSRTVGVSYDKLICLYEIYKEDVFFFFHILEGGKVTLGENVKCFPEERVFEKVFSRARTILDALNGFERSIRRYDMKFYRELERMYKNGQFYIEVDCGQ